VSATNEVASNAINEFDVFDNLLAWKCEFQRTASRVFRSVINNDVSSVVKVKLCLATLDGVLSFNTANLPSSLISGNGSVSQASIVVKDTSVVGISEGEDIHESNTTANVFADTTVNKCVTVVQDVTNFTG